MFQQIEIHLASSFQGIIGQTDQLIQALPLQQKQLPVLMQSLPLVEGWIIQDLCDLLQRKAQLPQKQDLLQPFQFLLPVQTVAAVGDRCGTKQSDLVVVMQRADADTGQGSKFFDGFYGDDLLSTTA